MTPERYQQIGEIYHDVLNMNREERCAFLDRACAGDEELRREVESLVASHEQASQFIAAPALAVAAELFAGNRPLVGQVLNHYRVLSLLGEGGMGEVYLAEDERLGRRVALKLLSPAFTHDEERMRRFMREARAASALNHPNILTVHEIGRVDGKDFMAMEFIEGQTLRSRMKSGLKLGQLLEVAVQMAEALAAAHAAGVVHRDIKPENIMVRPDGYVKVLDFGLAKLADPGLQAANAPSTVRKVDTTPGVVMGTVQYMSPEQARGLVVDARTDVWSLGVVLYEMSAGHLPFEGETPSDAIVSILEREPPPLPQLTPDFPPELERIVTRALNKNKDERYQTVKDMAIDLRELRRRLEIHAEIERAGHPAAAFAANSQSSPASSDASPDPGVRTEIQGVPRPSYPKTRRETANVKSAKPVRGVLVGIGLALLLGGLGYGLYKVIMQPKAKPRRFEAVKMSRLTATGKVEDAAISPDGRYVVYVEEDAGQQSLWVKQVATGSTVQIAPPADVGYIGLTFSNDNDYVYYVKARKGDLVFALYQVPTLGGTSKKIIDRVDSAVTFSPDGRRLAFVRADSSTGDSSLVLVNTDGTEEQILATRKRPNFFLWEGISRISWSPDGGIIACPAGTADTNGVYLNVVGVRVTDGAEQTLSSQRWSAVLQVSWLSDSSGLVMVAKEEEVGPGQLWRVSYPGGEVSRITNDLNRYTGVSLSGDSRILVAVQSKRASNIWIAPKGDSARAKQITSGTSDSSLGLSWMPDGRILYASDASGRQQIWVMDTDGSNQKQLTNEGYNFRPVIVPGGRYIVFHSFRNGAANVWRMDLDASNVKQLTQGKKNFFPDVSPDGQWVVYSSFDSGELNLWKVSIEGGNPLKLSTSTANLPSISPDGKYIASFYWDENATPASGVMIFPFTGGPPTQRFNILPDAINGFALHWSTDGLNLLHLNENLSNIVSQPAKGGKPMQLTNFQGDLIFNFAWSHDGNWLALARGTATDDAILVEEQR